MKFERCWYAAMTAMVLLSACGGGAADSTSTIERLTARALASTEPAGSNCADGGARIDAGIDRNGNGTLDASEITSTQYVCNGTTGAAGAIGATGIAGLAGAPGAAGADGLAALVKMSAEPAGVNCAAGGTRVDAGADVNADGVLESGETTSIAYVCNASNGATGSDGRSSLIAIVAESTGANCSAGGSKITSGLDTNGNGQLDVGEVASTAYSCNGATGAAGTNGTDGATTLVASVAEPAGVHCSAGGLKITSGVDTSHDGVLDAGEVTATSYVCNGSSGIGWIDVTTATVQAQSNTGYVADSASQVTIKLPASPTVGDVVRVSGAGAGGWQIAQNAGQSIVTSNLANDVSPATNWAVAASAPALDWRGVAMSADGSRLVAVASQTAIYVSPDAGVTWRTTESARSWTGVASSATGQFLVASGFQTQLYVSSNYGATWTAEDQQRPWLAVAVSADGSVMAAATGNGGQVYVSMDHGASWSTNMSDSANWQAVAMSADGSQIVAAANPGMMEISHDFGQSWTITGAPDNVAWQGLASSADGSKLVAVADSQQIYTSSDFGVTWAARDSARAWTAVTSSADGNRLVAVTAEDILLSSTVFAWSSSDGGVTWTQRAPSDARNAVASSADGTRIAATASTQLGDGAFWISAPAPVGSTTTGTTGGIAGSQYQAVELQCIGVNQFMVIDAIGTGFEVQ